MKKIPLVIPLFTIEARIKRSLRKHLKRAGFVHVSKGALSPCNSAKETIRDLHNGQRIELLKQERPFIEKTWPELKNYFANGNDILPERISPELEIVSSKTWQSDLFRLATLLWTIPVSQGYGRRLRFLVWDTSNHKLIGMIGLGDPVFNLKVRDQIIGWTAAQRKSKLVNLMDAYVLGAVPPYNSLLCGKLIACLVRSKEIRGVFSDKYSSTIGIISGKSKNAKYIAVTTSSALGRSSVYNRLSLNGIKYFRSVGYTSGWGHFHIPDSLFTLMRKYLDLKGHEYAKNHQFGEGPNWRLRAIRETMRMLNLNPNLLRHGIFREVFICEVASNARRYLQEKIHRAQFRGLLSVKDIANEALKRWIIPRSFRDDQYLNWDKENVRLLLEGGHAPTARSETTVREVRNRGAGKF
jgi:hypothetical protein